MLQARGPQCGLVGGPSDEGLRGHWAGSDSSEPSPRRGPPCWEPAVQAGHGVPSRGPTPSWGHRAGPEPMPALGGGSGRAQAGECPHPHHEEVRPPCQTASAPGNAAGGPGERPRGDTVLPRGAQQGSVMAWPALGPRPHPGSSCTLTFLLKLSEQEGGPPGRGAPVGTPVAREAGELPPPRHPGPSGCGRSWTRSDRLSWLSSALVTSQG